MTTELALSGWSAVSALGIGSEHFCKAIVAEQPGLGPDGGAVAPEQSREVPHFDIRTLLGRKGTRAMDRLTGLAVYTIGQLLDAEHVAGYLIDDRSTGLVLGTTTGSVQSMMDFTRDSMTAARPYLVDPARFPNGVMNRAAGQSAIWYGLQGPNATVATGQVAGLSALRYAARLHQFGHATSVLWGAAEEVSEQRTWLERRHPDDHGDPLGEGCAIFRLEAAPVARAAGRPVLAYVAASSFRVSASSADLPEAVALCAASALQAAGAAPEDVWAVACDVTGGHEAISTLIGSGHRRYSLRPYLGDTGAASAALQVAAVLAHADADPSSRGRHALVVAADRDGPTGSVVLRLPANQDR